MAMTLPEYPDERGARCVACSRFIIILNTRGVTTGWCDDCSEHVDEMADAFDDRSDRAYDAYIDDKLSLI